MMLAAISSLSIAAHAQTDFFKDLQISGFFDIYYQYSGNQPTSGKLLPLRQFDVRDNDFSLAAAYLSVVKPTTKDNPFGFTLNVLAGKDADIETSGEPGGPNDALKYLHQAYVTWAGPSGLTVDLGKFGTWIGLESPFAVNNDLYSLSTVAFAAQPIYHVGLRATKPLGSTTVGLYAVNGWNEAEDSNRSKSYGASIAHTFGKVSSSLNYYGGNEGASGTNGAFNTGESNFQLGDLVLSATFDKLKLSANGDYGSVAGLDAGASNGHYAAYDVVAKYQFSKSFSASARYDNFWDYQGVRLGTDARVNSGVLGLEYLTGAASVVRFEVRHDEANRQVFESDGSGGNKARTTFTLAHIFKF